MGTGCSSENSAAGAADTVPGMKIAIVGDPQVGKTSVLLRYVRNQFSPMYIPTKKVGIENVVQKLNVPANTIVSMTLWDIPGQEDMDVHKSYFRNLDAAIVVVDVTNERSIEMAQVWKQTLLNKVTKTVVQTSNNNKIGLKETAEVKIDPVKFPVLLLGNKYDLIESEVQQLFEKYMGNEDSELKHPRITQLEAMAEQHGFVGSVTVATNRPDSSVAMAIQSLVRCVLERDKNIPRKWHPVKREEEKKKEDREYYYDKLAMTGLTKFDEVFSKADILVKKISMLRHYLTVSFVRLKEVCINGGLVQKDKTSLEDCIMGFRTGVARGTSLKAIEDEGFFKLEVVEDDEEAEVKTKQSTTWKAAYKCFHREYAAICKTILKDCPPLEDALEKYDIAMSRMSENALTITPQGEHDADGKVDLEKVSNTIVFNRAKCQHAKQECKKCVENVEKATRRISAAQLW